MKYDEDLEQYVIEYKGIVFSFDEEPEQSEQETIRRLADNYYEHLEEIIRFMLPDLKEMYGEVTVEEIKEKLGKPVIDYNCWTVNYYEQSFDDLHLFTFEFLDDNFEELQYFSING